MSDNPSNLDALTAKYASDGGGANPPQLLQPDEQQVLGAAPTAITGGEAPTEAEFLALRTYVVDIADALIAVGICKL